MKKEYDYLIVGSGLFGAVFAQKATEKGKRCLVVDKRPHKGGNLYCSDMDNIRVHAYGAHIFHTDREHVWKYINRFTSFNHFINSPLASYGDKLYNLPFNMNTFYQLWGVKTPVEAKRVIDSQRERYFSAAEPANLEEQALRLCGDDIYYKFIKDYTEKQWGKPATELPAFIIKRIPFRFTFDNNYFNDPYQGIPLKGYNGLIDALLDGIEVKCNTNFFGDRSFFESLADKIVFSGCIDEFFSYRFGHLDYRSLRFEHEQLDINDYQGVAVVNHNEKKIPYTRVIEHKHFEFLDTEHTVITREYPALFTGKNEPYYPVNDPENMERLKKYKELSVTVPQVLFGGRLGQYAYFDMDDTIHASLQMADNELEE